MKKQKYHTVRTVAKSISKIDTP